MCAEESRRRSLPEQHQSGAEVYGKADPTKAGGQQGEGEKSAHDDADACHGLPARHVIETLIFFGNLGPPEF